MLVAQTRLEPRFYTSFATTNCTEVSFVTETIEARELKCSVKIEDLPCHDYYLLRPAVIEVERGDLGYVISHPDTGVFTYDADLKLALDQFFAAFIEQYEFLKANENELSPSLKHDLETFENLIGGC
jgi:hypothetical protein